MKKLLTLFMLLMSFAANAQEEPENLIYNGGFEKTRTHLGQIKFEGWSFHRDLVLEKVQGYKGKNSAKIHTNQAYFNASKYGKYNIIKVEGNAKYSLKFWFKGETGDERIEPVITWYENKHKLGEGEHLEAATPTTDWSEKSYSFTSPEAANRAGLAFIVHDDGQSIIIDEVSMIKTGQSISVGKPTGVAMQAFQRELEIYWHKGKPETKWEVVMDGISTIVETNRYVATKLEPSTNHKIKIRAVVGDDKSEFTDEQVISTQAFTKGKDDSFRVPHLRTLTQDGTPPQVINLFYNDLYNTNAEIKYFIDGQEIQVEDDKLHFPKKGKQVLKTIITEAEGYQWEIEYKLNVK